MIADDVAREILDRALPPGTRLGAEAEFVVKYGIGRNVWREAVRILEHDGIAVARRGPGGGLYVTRPEGAAVSRAAAVWVLFNRARKEDLYSVREVLESRVAQWAAERIDARGITELRDVMDRLRDTVARHDHDDFELTAIEFHRVIARLAENPVAELFVSTLGDLVLDTTRVTAWTDEEVRLVLDNHQLITDAIVSGDGALASHRMIAHVRDSFEVRDR